MPLPDEIKAFNSPEETFLNLSYVTTHDSPFWKAGYELGWNQFHLTGAWEISSSTAKNSLSLQDNETTLQVTGDDWSIEFNRKTGLIHSWKHSGSVLVKKGGSPDFWRAPTDNDRGAGLERPTGPLFESRIWQDAANSWEIHDVKAETTAHGVTIQFSGIILDGLASLNMHYELRSDGSVELTFQYHTDKELPSALRMGTQWILPTDFEQIEWYGAGPNPTYSDRNWERVGRFKTTVKDHWVDYSQPQENGNKVDVRWLKLTNQEGKGLLMEASAPLSCNVLPHSHELIASKAYSWQLPVPKQFYLNIDFAQLGVGGDNSWGAWAHPDYQLVEKDYRYSFRLTPIGF